MGRNVTPQPPLRARRGGAEGGSEVVDARPVVPDGCAPLRIVFMGTAAFAVPSLHALAEGQARGLALLTGVFAPPDRPAGRGRLPRAPAVKVAALELAADRAGLGLPYPSDLPVHQPYRVSRGEGIEQLRQLQPDLVVVAAFGEILSEEALTVPRLGAINIHASLLPRWRGAAPIQRAIMAGERVTGVSVQWMAREMDAGDLILQRQVEIGEEEDFGSLHDRLAAAAADAAVEAVELIRRSEAPHVPQDHSQATYAPAITPEDLTIDWSRPAKEIAGLVRALSPQPGARTTRGGNLLKVLCARAVPRAALVDRDGGPLKAGLATKKDFCQGGIPGQVMELLNEGFLVLTGDGCLLVLRVQPAGRKAMSAADYLKGYRLGREERLGS